MLIPFPHLRPNPSLVRKMFWVAERTLCLNLNLFSFNFISVKDFNTGQFNHYDSGRFREHQEDRVPIMQLQAGPSYAPGQVPMMHHYVHPITGEQIVSPLPPTHPEMICLQEGTHVRRTKFGLLGTSFCSI